MLQTMDNWIVWLAYTICNSLIEILEVLTAKTFKLALRFYATMQR